MVDWDLVGRITRSTYRTKVLRILMTGNKTNKQLAGETGIDKGNISKTISYLQKHGLVECLNPDLTRGKIFAVTGKGKEIVENIPE